MAKENEVDIPNLLETFKNNQVFKTFFVDDFLKRGKTTCDKIAAEHLEDVAQFNEWRTFQLRNKIYLADALCPSNLIFFTKQIFEKGYIEEDQKLLEFIRAMFDLHIAYSIVFAKDPTSKFSEQCIQMCGYLLDRLKENLQKFIAEEK